MSEFMLGSGLESGTSTPYKMFGDDFGATPGNLFGEKTDYFQSIHKSQPSDYAFTGDMFTTGSRNPYQDNDITPPHTGYDPPSDWGVLPKHETLEPSLPELNAVAAEAKNGQLTPPDEALRAPDLDDLQGGFPSAQESKSLKRESTSSIKSSKSSKKSKKNRSQAEESNEELEKRSKFLERNRVAASKCRQKKKEHNAHLEQRAKQLERDNNLLKYELERLQTEKINLMTQMSLHNPSDCDCHQIHQHLASFKAQFSEPMPMAMPTHVRNSSIVSTASTMESMEA